MSYADPDLTPAERVGAAFNEFHCDDESLQNTLQEQLKTFEGAPLMLIEEGKYGTWYMTLHGDRNSAVEYSESQECAEDWEWYALIDITTGQEV